MFSYNGVNGTEIKIMCVFRPVHCVTVLGAKPAVSDYIMFYS